MARWLAAFGIVMLMAGAPPLRADEMPWCVELDVFTKNCGFSNYDECVTVANNAATPATGTGRCVRNPNYQPPANAAVHPRAKRAGASAK